MAELVVGQDVRLRDQPGREGVIVGGPKEGADGERTYEVIFLGDTARVWVRADRLDAGSEARMRWVKQTKFLRDLAILKLRGSFSDILYSMGASRTQFLVYQFQPVLKFVTAMPHGMLIADEVGLGKTIEAGLILKELIARGSVHRVLVVCPANLRRKWQDEMQLRFGLEFRFITASEIREIPRQLEYGSWPEFFGIASLEGLRRDELRQILQESGIQFDMVIIDEAHHLRNPTTNSFDLGAILSDQADHILLLSATPVQTGAEDLLSLLRLIEPAHFRGTSTQELDELLEPNEHINAALRILARPGAPAEEVSEALEKVFQTAMGEAFEDNPLFNKSIELLKGVGAVPPDMAARLRRDLQRLHTLAPYYTRTRKREVADAATRRSHVITVPLSEREQNFYDAWVAYLAAAARAKHPAMPATWAISMRERQAASSIPVAAQMLDRLIDDDVASDIQSSEPDLPSSSRLSGTSSLGRLRANVEEAAEQVLSGPDSKYESLRELVKRLIEENPQRKILLFTFFKGTLRYLTERLHQDGIVCRAISGDDRPDSRSDTIAAFSLARDENVLLSTEVAAEGIDLQFCDAVINYDLPWNPMRIEQRIGRIDRFGQLADVVLVFSFFAGETIDTRILERLYARINVFEQSIGALEPILGDVIQGLMRDTYSQELTSEELIQRREDALQRVEYLQNQQEEFESQRAELLGQGDLIRQQITEMRQSGRYISQAELAALISEWLTAQPPAYESIEPIPTRRGVWKLRMSQQRVGRVFSTMNDSRRHMPAVNTFLQRILKSGHAWCTFDSDIAQKFTELAFIDAGHPLIQTVLKEGSAGGLDGPYERVASLELPTGEAWPNRMVLFLYKLELQGAEPQISLLPVALEPGESVVLDDLGETLLGALENSQDTANDANVTVDVLKALELVAYRFADAKRQEAETWASETQEARLATQRTTLTRSFSARIQRKEELASRVADSRIQRLHEGEVRNLQATFEAKLNELDEMADPFATLELIAIASCRPKPGSGGSRQDNTGDTQLSNST